MTAQELTEICEKHATLGEAKRLVEGIRDALRNNELNVSKYSEFSRAIESLEFSIDSSIEKSTLTDSGKAVMRDLIKRKVDYSVEFWQSHNQITKSICENDTDILFVPKGITVTPGSCDDAFYNATSLVWLSPDIDWSGATALNKAFLGTKVLTNDEYTLDLSSCKGMENLQLKVPTIHLKNMSKVAFANNQLNYVFTTYVKTVTGINVSRGSNIGSNEFLPGKGTVNATFEGVIKDRRFILDNSKGFSLASKLSSESLWSMISHFYDYNHPEANDDGYGTLISASKPSSDAVITVDFTAEMRQRTEDYYDGLSDAEKQGANGESCPTLKDYIEAKGWKY